MTFEDYLINLKPEGVKSYFDLKMWIAKVPIDNLLLLAQDWHTQELKSMRSKGANTTNTKYSKEQRSEWAKRGTKARLQRKLNK